MVDKKVEQEWSKTQSAWFLGLTQTRSDLYSALEVRYHKILSYSTFHYLLCDTQNPHQPISTLWIIWIMFQLGIRLKTLQTLVKQLTIYNWWYYTNILRISDSLSCNAFITMKTTFICILVLCYQAPLFFKGTAC